MSERWFREIVVYATDRSGSSGFDHRDVSNSAW